MQNTLKSSNGNGVVLNNVLSIVKQELNSRSPSLISQESISEEEVSIIASRVFGVNKRTDFEKKIQIKSETEISTLINNKEEEEEEKIKIEKESTLFDLEREINETYQHLQSLKGQQRDTKRKLALQHVQDEAEQNHQYSQQGKKQKRRSF